MMRPLLATTALWLSLSTAAIAAEPTPAASPSPAPAPALVLAPPVAKKDPWVAALLGPAIAAPLLVAGVTLQNGPLLAAGGLANGAGLYYTGDYLLGGAASLVGVLAVGGAYVFGTLLGMGSPEPGNVVIDYASLRPAQAFLVGTESVIFFGATSGVAAWKAHQKNEDAAKPVGTATP
jgi:hypothetical protein